MTEDQVLTIDEHLVLGLMLLRYLNDRDQLSYVRYGDELVLDGYIRLSSSEFDLLTEKCEVGPL